MPECVCVLLYVEACVCLCVKTGRLDEHTLILSCVCVRVCVCI